MAVGGGKLVPASFKTIHFAGIVLIMDVLPRQKKFTTQSSTKVMSLSFGVRTGGWLFARNATTLEPSLVSKVCLAKFQVETLPFG